MILIGYALIFIGLLIFSGVMALAYGVSESTAGEFFKLNDQVIIESEKTYGTIRKILEHQALVEIYSGDFKLVSVGNLRKTSDLEGIIDV